MPLKNKEGAPIRVLIVEDSENDALLMVRELGRGGYAPTYERVDTPEAMAAALDKQAWDIVLKVRQEKKLCDVKSQQLNSVLQSIRKVNQLIVREKNRVVLFEKTCQILTETRGYQRVWIAQAGEEAAKNGGVSSFSMPITAGDQTYGTINVYSVNPGGADEEEIDLLTEVAEDLGFALGALEEEAKRRGAEEELKERVKELEEFHDAVVGRELKMVGLEKEIEELKKKEGE